jgi:hypothetical protein
MTSAYLSKRTSRSEPVQGFRVARRDPHPKCQPTLCCVEECVAGRQPLSAVTAARCHGLSSTVGLGIRSAALVLPAEPTPVTQPATCKAISQSATPEKTAQRAAARQHSNTSPTALIPGRFDNLPHICTTAALQPPAIPVQHNNKWCPTTLSPAPALGANPQQRPRTTAQPLTSCLSAPTHFNTPAATTTSTLQPRLFLALSQPPTARQLQR